MKIDKEKEKEKYKEKDKKKEPIFSNKKLEKFF